MKLKLLAILTTLVIAFIPNLVSAIVIDTVGSCWHDENHQKICA